MSKRDQLEEQGMVIALLESDLLEAQSDWKEAKGQLDKLYERAISAEKKLDSIMQAIHDFDPYGYSNPGYEKLIDWIASTCPWFEEEMK